MHLVTLDFESFWSKEHSLSKLSPIEYVMHPETEIISCSVKVNNMTTDVVFGEDEIQRLLTDARIEDALVIAHNMRGFDGLVLAWRLKRKPKMWGCTLDMARPMFGRTPVGLSLDRLDKEFGGPGKEGHDILAQTKGRHLRDFTPAEVEYMRRYNGKDTDKCHRLFYKLLPYTSRNELWTIDSNIRMMVEDELRLDMPLLQAALQRERLKKHKTLMKLAGMLGFEQDEDDDKTAELVKSELMSAVKFSALLTKLDVPVPVKRSPTDNEKWIPALAKTDEEFTALREHDNPLVAMAATARLEMKSTLLETRIEAFLSAGHWRNGHLPIPAKYWGAHTGRDSGDLYNALNMPRIGWNKDGTIKPKLTNSLRLSLRAPEGFVVGVADLSGIELRTNHTLWKVARTMRLWAADPKADVYKDTASRYYGVAENLIEGSQRQFGKVLELACGFGVGPAKFVDFARGYELKLTLEQAQEGVWGWRNITPEIADNRVGGWARCQQALSYIEAGQEWAVDPWGLTHTCKEGIRLPDGNLIRYPDLRKEVNKKDGRVEWKYGKGRHTRYIYGGKVDENIVQALARIVLMDNVREFWRRTGLHTKLRVYDEAVYLFARHTAPELLEELLKIMRTPPKWWPALITWSEGDMAESYGLAK